MAHRMKLAYGLIRKCTDGRMFTEKAVSSLSSTSIHSPSLLSPSNTVVLPVNANDFGRRMSSTDSADYKPVLVSVPEAKAFIKRCMEKAGASAEHSQQMADVLVMADHRGHYSHGLNRLEMYVRDIKAGTCNAAGEPVVVKEAASTALVDGHNLLGPVVGKFAMDTAIKKAKESGVGWVAAKASNHYGIAGYYGLLAVDQGLIGMSFTNTSPLCVPTRGKTLALGSNPICFAAPGLNGDSFVLDMASTTVAIGKIELAMRKKQTIPPVWGVDSSGEPSTDPAKVYNGGGLLPLGGSEDMGGYKGYGLNMMVEILCGILADAAFGPNVRPWSHSDREANLGQGFIAVDPGRFGEDFAERLQGFIDLMRHLPPADPSKPVLVAGDPERIHIAKCENLGGIPYHPNQFEHAIELAKGLDVQPMRAVGQ
ncbi:Malate/(S)-sulfolactate dehydrogenase [Hypsibius exemplaris]|uniref:Malate/(S)-sulfolactate dehydrogenase n=1 Tax=Hypsibius exemplaris TaxID=2072580 RepID=A0A1W0WP32_HYPEX|nr:Malate/(S)-sulfolactate dehydrogenase [Hypsibius exemplaris]